MAMNGSGWAAIRSTDQTRTCNSFFIMGIVAVV
jgi:hypothetical protein